MKPPGSAKALTSSESITLMVKGTWASELRTRFWPTRLTYSVEFFGWTVLDWSGGVSAAAAGCGVVAGAGVVLSGAGGGGGGCLLSGMGEADCVWSGV